MTMSSGRDGPVPFRAASSGLSRLRTHLTGSATLQASALPSSLVINSRSFPQPPLSPLPVSVSPPCASPLPPQVQCGAASEALTQCLRNHGLSLDPMLLVSEPSPQSDLCLPALHAYQRCGRDVLLVLELTRQGGCQAEVAAARRCNEAPSANCESAELAAMLCLQRGAASRPPD